MPRVKAIEQSRLRDAVGDRFRTRQTHRSDAGSECFFEVLLECMSRRRDALGVGKHPFTEACQAIALLVPLHQDVAQFAFQLGQPTLDRRLIDGKCTNRRQSAAVPRDCDEIPEVIPVLHGDANCPALRVPRKTAAPFCHSAAGGGERNDIALVSKAFAAIP